MALAPVCLAGCGARCRRPAQTVIDREPEPVLEHHPDRHPAGLRRAKKRVKAQKEFYRHLTSYLVMGVFFFLLNAVTSFGNWWFYWPMLGWGIGILFHYFDVFGLPGVGEISKEWEERIPFSFKNPFH